MRITLDYTKSVEQNAAIYFEKAKKAKRKLEGAHKALDATKRKIEKLSKKQEQVKQQPKEKTKEYWFHKFRWFYTSEGFLVIGGRDATSNEIVVKKHTNDDDIIFHTEIAGSPFCILKTEGKKPGKASLEETAIFVASYSKAWKMGLAATEVYWVTPDQVSQTPRAGEFLPKGGFMIYGKKNFMHANLELALAKTQWGIMCSPLEAARKHTKEKIFLLGEGRDKASDIAKQVKKELGGNIDDIIRVLPPGSKIIRTVK